MTELALLRALVAAYTLRQVLHEESVSSGQLSQARAQLLVEMECEDLIEDRDCLIPLAVVREWSGIFLREKALAETEDRSFPHSSTAALRFARHALSRLIARLWTLTDMKRRAPAHRVKA